MKIGVVILQADPSPKARAKSMRILGRMQRRIEETAERQRCERLNAKNVIDSLRLTRRHKPRPS